MNYDWSFTDTFRKDLDSIENQFQDLTQKIYFKASNNYSNSIIANYDAFIREGINDIISTTTTKLTDENNTEYHYTTNEMQFTPTPSNPVEALRTRVTYELIIRIKINKYVNGKLVPMNSDKSVIEIGRIPLMVGSSYCPFNKIKDNKKALFEAGLNPDIPINYFIIDGGRRYNVLSYEQLVMNRPSIMKFDKNDVYCRFLFSGKFGTVNNKIFMTEDNVIRLFLQSFDKSNQTEVKNKDSENGSETTIKISKQKKIDVNDGINVLNFIYYLNSADLKKKYGTIDRWIEEFFLENLYHFISKKEFNDKIKIQLASTINNFLNHYKDNDIDANLIVKLGKLLLGTQYKEDKNNEEKIKTKFRREFFSNADTLLENVEINEENKDEYMKTLNKYRTNILLSLIAKYAEYLAGFRKANDKDSWTEKRLITVGSAMEIIFRDVWRFEIKKANLKSDFESLKNHISKEVGRKLKDDFHNSFVSSNWGSKKGTGKLITINIAQELNLDTKIATYAQARSDVVNMSRESSGNEGSEIRGVNPSQYGFIDPIYSPEGANAGLVKIICNMVAVTPAISEINLINQIRAFKSLEVNFKQNYEKDFENVLMFSGKILGFVNDQYYPELLKIKRSGKIDRYTTVLKENNYIIIDCSPGRLVRPVFILDENEKLKFDIDLLDENKLIHELNECQNYLENDQLPNFIIKQFFDKYNNTDKKIKVVNEILLMITRIQRDPLEYFTSLGYIEYISPLEQNYKKVAYSLYYFNYRKLEEEKYKKIIFDSEVSLDMTTVDKTLLESDLDSLKKKDYSNFNLKKINTLIENQDITSINRIINLLEDYLKNPNKDKNALIDFIAINKKKLATAQEKYDYLDINSQAMLGITSTTVPYPNRNQAPRNTYQVNMVKQALDIVQPNSLGDFSLLIKTSAYSSKPKVTTKTCIDFEFNQFGQQVINMFLSVKKTEEDAFILNNTALQRGTFRNSKYITITETLNYDEKLHNNGSAEHKHLTPVIPNSKFIGGLPYIGLYMKKYMVIFCKIDSKQNTKQVLIKPDEEGIVDDIRIVKIGKDSSRSGELVVQIRLRITRQPQNGDKFSPRNAQKGTVGKLSKERDIPYTRFGIRPTIIANVLQIPSRMTVSYILEMFASKAYFVNGKKGFIDATCFYDFNPLEYKDLLKNKDFDPEGNEEMYSPTSGEKLEKKIFISCCYFQILRHIASDKISFSQYGCPVSNTTKQPLKSKIGQNRGKKFGEMETLSMGSHGASSVLQERTGNFSDLEYKIICNKCNFFSYYNSIRNMLYCPACGNTEEKEFTKISLRHVVKYISDIFLTFGINIQVKPDIYP